MSAPRRPLITILVPVLNEEQNIAPFYERLTGVIEKLPEYRFEILFTDNHSTDTTFDLIESLAKSDQRIRALRFSRDFGFQRSILTGYREARGDAAIQIDCDLQDPPELIPQFIGAWRDGNEVVYGVRRSRQEPAPIRWARSIFYRLIDRLSEDHLPHDTGDFRLVGSRVLAAIRAVDDNHPYLRGLIASFGFDQIGIPYDRDRRVNGKSKFSFPRLVSLAVDGILAHSLVPLRIATVFGLLMAVLMAGGIVYYAVNIIFLDADLPRGFATIVLLLMFSMGLNALFLGVIGEYLGRTYRQVRQRPLTIVEKAIGFDRYQPSHTDPWADPHDPNHLAGFEE